MSFLLHKRPPLSPLEGVDPPVWDTSLLGNPLFNPLSPTYKSGTPLGEEGVEALTGMKWLLANDASHILGSMNSKASSDDLYTLGRQVRDQAEAYLVAFRLTGDLTLLDAVMGWLDLAKSTLQVGYRGHNQSVVDWDASPYRCWVTTGGGQPSTIYGTDLSTMNEVKWHALLAEVAWALHLNRDFVSPGGRSYSTDYGFWFDYLVNDFVPKWSGGGTSGWRDKYRGVRNSSWPYPPYGRQSEGEWPIVMNGAELHSTQSSAVLAYYMSLLTGSSAARDESDRVVDGFLEEDSVLVGSTRVWGHQPQSNGPEAASSVAQGTSYVAFTLMDYVTMFLEGGHPQITEDVLNQMNEAVSSLAWLRDENSNSSSTTITHEWIVGDSPLGGFTLGGGFTGVTQGQAFLNPWFVLAPWGSDGYLLSEARRLLVDKPWAGSLEEPTAATLPVALLLNDWRESQLQ